MVVLDNGVLVCSFRVASAEEPFLSGRWGAYPVALQDYRRRYQAEVGIQDPSKAAGDYVMVSLNRGHTWLESTLAHRRTASGRLYAAGVQREG